MIIVTLDGPSGSGKGTLGRLLAKRLNWSFIETGLFYRFLAKVCLTKGYAIQQDTIPELIASDPFRDIDLEDPDLRSEKIAEIASKLAVYPLIRAYTTQKIRTYIEHLSVQGVIVDGRDAGTAIYPQAALKFYLTAHPDIRLQRRQQQNQQECISTLVDRDKRDETRTVDPLLIPQEAIVIDNSNHTVEESCALALAHIHCLLK